MTQDKPLGGWRGAVIESDPVLATCFALLLLARGRAPALIHKLRHAPLDDWNNDPDDVRHLVDAAGRDWKRPLNWQVIDSKAAMVADLRRAPLLFFNGHKAPEFSAAEKTTLRDYGDRGRLLFAEACCGGRAFDDGFRRLMKELFPENESRLHPLPDNHPLRHASRLVDPVDDPLWGIRRGGRTVVVYSPKDLSCYRN